MLLDAEASLITLCLLVFDSTDPGVHLILDFATGRWSEGSI
jgi:hypothetical protein